MNKKAKIIASIAAAVALGTGVAVYEFTSDEESQVIIDGGIDWEQYELNVPTIEIPKLDVPKLEIVKLDVPVLDLKLDDVNAAVFDDSNTVTLNKIIIDATEISIPKLVPTNISAPSVASLILKIDSLDLNKSYKIENDVVVPTLSINGIEIPGITAYAISIPTIPDEKEDFDRWVELQKTIQKIFIDDRMIANDPTMNGGNQNITKWIEIYKNNVNNDPIQYVQIEKPFKMISEACIPKTYEDLARLEENLRFYKSEGYDSVLVTFTLNDSAANVLNSIKYIRQYCKMDVWLAFTGKEDLKETVFGDPNKFKDVLQRCAPYVVGYVNSWRRTSAHIWKQDNAFMNFTNKILRNSNPGIKIVGELYFGNTYKYSHANVVGFETNIFDNASGILISNFGYSNVDYNRLMNKIIKPRIGSYAPIGLVVGTNAYYLTEYPNGLMWQDNIATKHNIETKFIQNGCIGTITLQDDGRGYNESNNLCKTLYSSLTSKK